jgi:hypothetical protein
MRLVERSNNVMPSVASSCLTCWLIAGWVMPRTDAARRADPQHFAEDLQLPQLQSAMQQFHARILEHAGRSDCAAGRDEWLCQPRMFRDSRR